MFIKTYLMSSFQFAVERTIETVELSDSPVFDDVTRTQEVMTV